ncbi:cob(I)yrinic acid a,c-diamide adenosyltransferase [Candidatus Falkowbacteria bacterium]|uniref:Cob(I)yrinic acid a,c-diamide adenosyltransferase n=1 Tax=Candidatus Buchananbacteria bacterium CG10_big_fil_rev_8_21_14_0_10_33_19 TaxID=1974525 RepID=A0A2H0W4D1_9BACT|nr:cob(I)yrinic acid a,c-diamide adenosyltransferase [Candidatus Falkowbacteria bacterium]PIS06215.1 MAG: cob(I)yrinic acid a,c-diamide adenosyltransferase [Candidatus Buchananbacteria bacterium CG10_big_fil_rev_8_21_14_0_10_33_19]
MIQVYYGDGKGKTTASLGLVLRAKGFGSKVAIIFFDKGGDNYNERKILEDLGIDYFSFGRDRRSSDGRFDFSLESEDLDMAQQSMAKLLDIQHNYDLIVLDEVLNAVRLKMLPLVDLLDYLDNSLPQDLELILTGRGLWPEIEARADLITEMRMVKHYFEQKVPARAGIEF